MNIIVAVNSDWGIGYNNAQPIVLPEDRQNFRKITDGGLVIAGRKTFEELGRPLPKRKNIVLTHDRSFKAIGVVAAHSIDEVLAMIAEEDTSRVFVIGGGVVYKQFLPHCSHAYVTKIEAETPIDTYFPNLDKLPDWSQETGGDIRESGGIRYSFNRYVNNAVSGGK